MQVKLSTRMNSSTVMNCWSFWMTAVWKKPLWPQLRMRQLCPQPSQKHHQPPQKLHQPPQKLHQLTICFQLCHSHQLPKLHQPVPILQLQHRLQSQHGHKFPSQMEYLKKHFEEVRRWQIMPKITPICNHGWNNFMHMLNILLALFICELIPIAHDSLH